MTTLESYRILQERFNSWNVEASKEQLMFLAENEDANMDKVKMLELHSELSVCGVCGEVEYDDELTWYNRFSEYCCNGCIINDEGMH